jgi:hypothetical protein
MIIAIAVNIVRLPNHTGRNDRLFLFFCAELVIISVVSSDRHDTLPLLHLFYNCRLFSFVTGLAVCNSLSPDVDGRPTGLMLPKASMKTAIPITVLHHIFNTVDGNFVKSGLREEWRDRCDQLNYQ